MRRLKSIADSMEEQKISPSLKTYLNNQGVQHLRFIPNQGICGLEGGRFTVDLLCHVSYDGKAYRYMYEGFTEAYLAIKTWDGTGHPPGPWIKCKGKPGGDIVNMDHAHLEALEEDARR